ncbi:hypothetical protein CRENBAI_000958 [Crenichthys baileyi]|uniref:Uncharacterized protein n=1 Tax=Crenichthys baileyi TaxID=28760 RepID=A0AAV9QV23_9TELE
MKENVGADAIATQFIVSDVKRSPKKRLLLAVAAKRIKAQQASRSSPNRSGFSPRPGKGGRDLIARLPGSESYPAASWPFKEPNVPLSQFGWPS